MRKVGSCCDVVLVNESAEAVATLDGREGDGGGACTFAAVGAGGVGFSERCGLCVL